MSLIPIKTFSGNLFSDSERTGGKEILKWRLPSRITPFPFASFRVFYCYGKNLDLLPAPWEISELSGTHAPSLAF
jgi:hypothetical protein